MRVFGPSLLAIGAAALVTLLIGRGSGNLPVLTAFLPALLLAGLHGLRGGVLTTGLAATVAVVTDHVGLGANIDPGLLGVFVLLGVGIAVVGERHVRQLKLTEGMTRELRDRESYLQSILDAAPDAMMVIDDRGLITTFGAKAVALFGWSPTEVIGRNISMLMPAPYSAGHDGYIQRYLATGEHRIIGRGRAVEGLKKDGAIFPMRLTVGEMRAGDRTFFTGFAHDLTEQYQAESRVRELQGELIHVTRISSVGEMASSLAHELNQPLSAIANYLRGSLRILARDGEVDRERIRDGLNRAAQQAIRAGEVIRRLREFLGRGQLERKPEHLSEIVREASELALVGAKVLGVDVTMTFDPACDAVFVDKVQIQQVVLNLIRNGMDAMENSAVRRVAIVTEPAGPTQARVIVSDTGPGITPEFSDRLFTPFMTTKKDGMGIGLSICRTIIEAHGGSIHAEGNPGGGARFVFTLPVDEGRSES